MSDSSAPPHAQAQDAQACGPGADAPAHHVHPRKRRSFWQRHSLSIVSICIVIVWIVAYTRSDPSTHIGSFFGNAIADWSGVVVTVLATKWLYEKNSRESRKAPNFQGNPICCFLEAHSLSIFLLITGILWVIAFAKMDPNSRWGQVVGNIVSEWTQIFGTVLLTKKLIEWGSKE